MAQRIVAIIAAGFVALLVLAPLVTVVGWAGIARGLTAADWAALRFTLIQAFWSATLSVLCAWPLARALARRRFWGRRVIIITLGAPFILPVLVAIMGVLAVFGQNGLVNGVLANLGMKSVSIYGISGVLLVHVFFNLPLVTRMILQGWDGIPAERLRLAQSLGLNGWALFRVVEWPMLRQIVPSAFGVVFVICLSSFAVALTLGGGPKATTLELAIYQAFRFDFDLAKAAQLAVIQALLAGAAAAMTILLGSRDTWAGTLGRAQMTMPTHALSRVLDGAIIVAGIAFLAVPVAMVLANGLPHIASLPATVWVAALRSVLLALGAVILSLTLAIPLATRWGEMVGTAGLVVSPLVLGAGLFLMLRLVTNPFEWALVVTLILNAVLSLPFVLRILRPANETLQHTYGPLGQSLGLGTLAWLRWVALPRLRPQLGFAAGLVAALSMGDLGVIALFGTAEQATLPLKIYQLMGAYRSDAAAGASVLLLLLSLGAFWVFDTLGQRNAHI